MGGGCLGAIIKNNPPAYNLSWDGYSGSSGPEFYFIVDLTDFYLIYVTFVIHC